MCLFIFWGIRSEFIRELIFGADFVTLSENVHCLTKLFSNPKQRPGGRGRHAISNSQLGEETEELPHRGGVSSLTLLVGKEISGSVKETQRL